MTRKKFIKKMMALGQPRNIAQQQAKMVEVTGSYDVAYKLSLHILLHGIERIMEDEQLKV